MFKNATRDWHFQSRWWHILLPLVKACLGGVPSVISPAMIYSIVRGQRRLRHSLDCLTHNSIIYRGPTSQQSKECTQWLTQVSLSSMCLSWSIQCRLYPSFWKKDKDLPLELIRRKCRRNVFCGSAWTSIYRKTQQSLLLFLHRRLPSLVKTITRLWERHGFCVAENNATSVQMTKVLAITTTTTTWSIHYAFDVWPPSCNF